MPWTHCGAPEIPDSEPCPGCGITKEKWTLEFDVTRQFTVRRRPTVRVELLDEQGNDVAGEPWRLELPGGAIVEGTLDEKGEARHTHDARGDCTISFPRRAAGEVAPYVAPDGEDEDADGAPPPAAASGAASFVRPADRRHRFQLRPALVLQLTLVDEQGLAPLRFVPYTLAAPGGPRFEGVTDGRGRLDHGRVAPARYALTVRTEVDGEPLQATVPATPVVPLDAFLRLRVAGVPHVAPEPHEDEGAAPANPRWSTTRCRFDEVVELIWEVPEAEEGAGVELEVFEHDADGAHDLVAAIVTLVEGGQARAGWHMARVEDTDDEATELDRATGFALPEFFFVARRGDLEARCDELLTFATDLELPLVDARGGRLADTSYALVCDGQVRRGRTDAQGVLREAGVGPDFLITVGEEGQERVLSLVEGGAR